MTPIFVHILPPNTPLLCCDSTSVSATHPIAGSLYERCCSPFGNKLELGYMYTSMQSLLDAEHTKV